MVCIHSSISQTETHKPNKVNHITGSPIKKAVQRTSYLLHPTSWMSYRPTYLHGVTGFLICPLCDSMLTSVDKPNKWSS